MFFIVLYFDNAQKFEKNINILMYNLVIDPLN